MLRANGQMCMFFCFFLGYVEFATTFRLGAPKRDTSCKAVVSQGSCVNPGRKRLRSDFGRRVLQEDSARVSEGPPICEFTAGLKPEATELVWS